MGYYFFPFIPVGEAKVPFSKHHALLCITSFEAYAISVPSFKAQRLSHSRGMVLRRGQVHEGKWQVMQTVPVVVPTTVLASRHLPGWVLYLSTTYGTF